MASEIFLDISAVACRYGIGRSTVARLFRKGAFPPPLRIGKVFRWKLADLEAWEATANEYVAQTPALKPVAN